MEQKSTRRAIMANCIAAAASIALPATAKASEASLPQSLIDNPPTVRTDHALTIVRRMQADMEGVNIMEVLTSDFAPHYRKGDLVFVKPAKANPADHVFLKLKSGPSVFGAYVHNDGKSLYVRGFKAGDKIKGIPFANVREWGRIVVSYRA